MVVLPRKGGILMRVLELLVLTVAAALLPVPALAGAGGWFGRGGLGVIIIMLAIIIYMLSRHGRS